MKAIHNLSKEARQEIINILLEKRSRKELAEELGITPAAIVKFTKGLTHPSDDTILKALEIASDDEKEKIVNIILNDLVNSVIEVFSEYPNVTTEKIDELKKILDEIEGRKLLASSGFI
ncbi:MULTISPECIES: helix-turn-helix domain-containing protein [Acidianus]|jgi:transcriptional regulator with XRE-family HTH domain|uniref:XRE family transcriptional regulator n=3 Tax=Acidianus TaxID=12914 RepID=A0A2T9X3N5_9CREN|nr:MULTISPECIES: helix-turn-helix transcriptional regulator [Acidianus]AEE93468.1 transcriptional regulator, XRE family [Acidianus hospitalis W1]MUM64698.1 helix-turn-helix domain-containing protein [Acidianus infernus]PVU74672.1 XRE family transcriptional regulator [Acidianus hospitalis]